MNALLSFFKPRRRSYVAQGRQTPVRGHFQRRVPTMFSILVRDHVGRLKMLGKHHPNLRTNDGLDWQAGVMGDYTSFGSTATGSTGFSTTSLTDTAQSWTTDQWKGHLVLLRRTGSCPIYGVILTNSATVLTIDRWYDPTNPGGAAATAANNVYGIMPGGMPHWWMALSSDSGAPAAGDTTLTSELTTNGFARALPTAYTHTAGTNSYSISKTFTATGTATINKEAVFNAQNGGRMPFESAEPSPPTLVSGDTLAQTVTITI